MSDFTEGSGNVFADIGVADPDTALVKAKMIVELKRIVGERGLTQDQLAQLVGVDQPTVSKVLRGRLSSITLDRLIRWLTLLGCNVEITLGEPPAGEAARCEVRTKAA
ncbi:MAG TPA: helix-turn-helix transcriptional regulator [Azospirillum sp.]|nr:helix-turn-helix transcriptional regulator [Azospirillum sp.]